MCARFVRFSVFSDNLLKKSGKTLDFSDNLWYTITVIKMYADLAHLVERNLAKVEVAGSIPVIRSKNKRHTPLCAPQKPIRKRNGKAVKKNAPMGNHGQFFSVILRYQARGCRIDVRQMPNIKG